MFSLLESHKNSLYHQPCFFNILTTLVHYSFSSARPLTVQKKNGTNSFNLKLLHKTALFLKYLFLALFSLLKFADKQLNRVSFSAAFLMSIHPNANAWWANCQIPVFGISKCHFIGGVYPFKWGTSTTFPSKWRTKSASFVMWCLTGTSLVMNMIRCFFLKPLFIDNK